MRVMNVDSGFRKKARGLKRKTGGMIAEIARCAAEFPDIDPEEGYWHMHLPVAQAFINSARLPFGIRRKCAQTLIDAAAKLAGMAPNSKEGIRAVAYINLPDLWYSELIVFSGTTHYDGYFERDNGYQKWIPLDGRRNLAREWHLEVPEGFAVKGYREILINDGEEFENELWYIGQLG